MKLLQAVKEKMMKAKAKVAAVAALAVAMVSAIGTQKSYAAPLDFTGTDVGITTSDVMGTAINFIKGVVPDFVLLGLGIIFAVVIVGFLFWVVGKIRRAAPGK